MSIKTKIFNVLLVVAMLALPVGAARAEDDDECVVYNPAFALCTTHAHNAGFVKDGMPSNPTSGEETSYMNEVIALKATVIAQQLKQQYETLNTMIKRFKTQLEKAVLTSKVEMLTGNASSSGGSSKSGASSNTLAGTDNCDSYTDIGLYDCLVRNLNKIRDALDGNDMPSARKQLKNDISIANDYKMCDGGNCDGTTIPKCDKIDTASKGDLKDCVTTLIRKVQVARNKFQQEQNSYRYRG